MALDSENVLRRQGAPWARDVLMGLAYDDPDRCWRVISLVALQTPNEEALTFLGVTLSGLLCEHPSQIEAIAHDVAQNPKLSELMSWVAEDDAIETAVRSRVDFLSKVKQ